MKKLLLISSLLMPTTAFANVAWFKGPFWQTAYRTNYSTKIQNENKEISERCAYLETTFLEKHTGISETEVRAFRDFNSLPLHQDMTTSLRAEIKTTIPGSMVLEDLTNSDLKPLIEQRAKSDVLPSYTQKPAVVVLRDDGYSGPVRVKYAQRSLLAAGKKLGVPSKDVKLTQRNDAFVVSFSSWDVMCDVLSNRASLEIELGADVKIDLQGERNLTNVYTKVEEISLGIVAKTASPKARAALLGFHVGSFLANNTENQDPDAQMLELLNLLFDEKNMVPSGVWTEAFGKKMLVISGVAANQKVLMEIKGADHEVR